MDFPLPSLVEICHIVDFFMLVDQYIVIRIRIRKRFIQFIVHVGVCKTEFIVARLLDVEIKLREVLWGGGSTISFRRQSGVTGTTDL